MIQLGSLISAGLFTMISENYKHNLNEPPEFGELTMSFSLKPVSLQSSTKKKQFVIAEIRKKTEKLKYLLSGDVKVEIQWLVHEKERYESAYAPDIDNIIKPILDGISGPKGILIDDCQIQAVGSHWIDWTKQDHLLNITIRYIADDFVSKENLVFVNMGNNLYMPFNTDIPMGAKKILVGHLKMMMEMKNLMQETTEDYYQAKMFVPIQRVFHKSRVSETFNLTELKDFETGFQ